MSIHYDMTYAEYDKIKAWRWSHIKILKDGSPHALQYARSALDNDTADRRRLRAIHALVFEPDNYDRDFSVYDDKHDKRAKGYKAHVKRCPGTSILKQHAYDSAEVAAAAVLAHPAVSKLLAEGNGEVVLTWDDEATGLPCKARMDWLGPLGLVDLKTLGTVHERRVAGHVGKMLYHGQLGHYTNGLQAHDIDVPAYIIAAEGRGAHEVAVFRQGSHAPDGPLYVGMELRARLMEQLAECVESGLWPMRHPEIQEGTLPMYAIPDEDDQLYYEETP